MNSAILDNLVATLSQIKLAGQQNVPVCIDHQSKTLNTLTLAQWYSLTLAEWAAMPVEGIGPVTVAFYLDAQRTVPVFSENTTDNPTSFYTASGRAFYVPPDTKLNDAETTALALRLSDLLGMTLEEFSTVTLDAMPRTCQPVYYVTVTFADGFSLETTYRNSQNLLFGAVVASTKKEPDYTPNESTAWLVPSDERSENHQTNDYIQFDIDTYDFFIRMGVQRRDDLSDLNDVKALQSAANAARTALMVDKYRGGNSVFYDRDINGTYVGDFAIVPSKDYPRAKLTIKCPHQYGYQGVAQ